MQHNSPQQEAASDPAQKIHPEQPTSSMPPDSQRLQILNNATVSSYLRPPHGRPNAAATFLKP